MQGASLIAGMRTRDLSNIQVFALSLPRSFVIIPNHVGPAHLQRKDRHVAAWVSRDCCLSKERFLDPTAPTDQLPTPKAPTSHRTDEGKRLHYWKLPTECSRHGKASTRRGLLLVCSGPSLLGKSRGHSTQGRGSATAVGPARGQGFSQGSAVSLGPIPVPL